MSQQQPLCHTGHLGGGIWRIKWHPHTPNRMLVAAMHGGCRVVNFGVLSPSEEQSRDSSGGGPKAWVTKKFTEHESMAYGADWLTVPHPKQNGYFEGAARYVDYHFFVSCTPIGANLTIVQLLLLRQSRVSMGYSILDMRNVVEWRMRFHIFLGSQVGIWTARVF